jgi:AcrR family transcriptional regulator
MLTDRAVDLRFQLIEAASRLIRTRGVAALTTREIAREAGCSDGALYTHFPHKSDLLMAVCQERLPDLRGQVGDLVSRVGSGTVEGNLEELIRATQTFMAELVPIATAVAADSELRMRHRAGFDGEVIPPRRTLEALAGYVAAEQRIGRVAANVAPQVFASMLVGACYSAANVEYIFGEPGHGIEPGRYARELARALWLGMAPRAEETR